MSQTTPYRPRHARPDDPADAPAPSTAPVFSDVSTTAIPIIPAQRVAGPLFESPAPGSPAGPTAPGTRHLYPAEPAPAGLHPVVDVPAAPRRRVLPAVLAVVTAALLASGIAVALGGAADADLTTQPVPVVAP